MTRSGVRQVYGIDLKSMSYERISTSFPGSMFRCVIIHAAPGYRSEPISHPGEELILCSRAGLPSSWKGCAT